MLKLARGSSNFSVSSVDYDCSARPKREAQKRKGVHFNDELDALHVNPCTMATSTFLRQRGIPWNSLARTFGCEDEMSKDDTAVMRELLNLCSFWSESEPIFRGPNDESDDEDESEDDLESFEHHIALLASSNNPRFSAACSSTSSGVSSLRLNSFLRLSSQSYRSSINSSETLSCLSKSPFSYSSPPPQESFHNRKQPTTTESLENAFKGIVEDDNGVSQDSVLTSKTAVDDFWSQVEF